MSLLMLAATLAIAQHHHHHVDPFAGSNCTCDTFCDYKCAINASKPMNKTYYRMTMAGVYGMADKDTGDEQGDTSFVLSRATQAYECRKDPNNFMCKDIAQFQGDDPNSTDLVISFKIEVDGQWGPYLACNPINVSDPLGAWHCTTMGGIGGTTPPQCKAANYTAYSTYCFIGSQKTVVKAADNGECCSAASAHNAGNYNYFPHNHSCELFHEAFHYEHCHGVGGNYDDTPPACNCTRVHKTIGRENLTVAFGSYASMHPAGGEWYSHPSLGQCVDGHYVGDGSGCTWRVVERSRVIKASCIYARLYTNVEGHDPACFAACPQPNNVTSDCFLSCYSKATREMTHDQLTEPWIKAFASPDPSAGGCPEVDVPPA